LSELRQQLRDGIPGSVVKLTVKRASGTQDVSITLHDLI
jgi:hypothetical protein